MLAHQIEYPTQVVGREHQPYISRYPVDSLFGDDVVEIPLAFYGAIGVLYDRLPALIEMFPLLHIPPIDVDVVLVLGPFNDPSSASRVFGAKVRDTAVLTARSFKMLDVNRGGDFSGFTFPFFPVPGTVSGQNVSLQTGIGM